MGLARALVATVACVAAMLAVAPALGVPDRAVAAAPPRLRRGHLPGRIAPTADGDRATHHRAAQEPPRPLPERAARAVDPVRRRPSDHHRAAGGRDPEPRLHQQDGDDRRAAAPGSSRSPERR